MHVGRFTNDRKHNNGNIGKDAVLGPFFLQNYVRHGDEPMKGMALRVG